MKLSFTGIRFRLLALVCISLFPLVLFTLYLAEERRRGESDHARDQVRILARLVATSHASILAQSRQLLAGLVVGNEHADDALLGPDCGAQLRRVMRMHSLYKQAALVRPNGAVYCAAEPLPQAIDLGDREFFLDAIGRKSSVHSSVIDSRLTGTKAIMLAEPVLDRGGGVIAVLVAALGLDWIDERLRRASLPPDAGAVLLDAQGVVLAAFPQAQLAGRSVVDAEAFGTAIRQADEGLMEGKGLDGVERVFAYARFPDLPGPGVYIRVGFPKAQINAVAIRTLRSMVIGLGLVLAIAMAGGWVGANALVVRPIRLLTAAADRLGKGDLAARTGMAHGRDEIGQLAARFDELAGHVQRTTRALRALSAGNRLILRERDENLLLQAMCAVAVEKGGYPVAVVNYARHDPEKSLLRMAAAGDDAGFLDAAAKPTWADAPAGRGTAGTAVRTGARSVIRSVAREAAAAPWRDEALKRGLRSFASFPLYIDGEVVGAFTLMARQEDAFDDDELELLDEVAADLSFGIAIIRSRQKLEAAERIAERAATHDLLTGLANAASFLATMTRGIAEARAANEPLAVLVVHLARLQEVYDSLGYEPGNLIVKEVAGRLRGLPDLHGPLARLGLEDFAVALKNGDARAADAAARSILSQFRLPVQASGAQFEIQAAVGASYYPGHGDEPELLVRRATLAARDAARRGVPYFPYQGTTERENPGRLAMAADLRQAIEQRSLTLHYQRKLDLRSGATSGCEALIRWRHPSRGMIPPGQFVPIAEQTGLIREMTYFVLDAAVRQQRSWMTAGKPLPIAVNLSVRNLYDAGLMERIEGLLGTWGVPPELVEFEITESALMEEPDAARAAIANLRRRGSKIYIDDFGTGYSSLSYLVSLPVHALKIDRAFVVQMTRSPEARSVVASIISMAHGLGLRVVAEGVETAGELAQLKEMDCDDVQGYYTGRPVPAEEFAGRGA